MISEWFKHTHSMIMKEALIINLQERVTVIHLCKVDKPWKTQKCTVAHIQGI